MSSFFHKWIFSILISCIFVSGILHASPPAPPNGMPAGWLFGRYFVNMVQEGIQWLDGICNNGWVIIGFNTGSTSVYWLPICKTLAELWGNVGNASQWTKNGNDIAYTGWSVWIGTIASSNTSLKLAGEIQIWNNNNICTSSIAWSIRYNSSLKILEFCDGTDWWKILFQQTSFPTNLILSHSSRSKNFTFSWNAGSGNGGSCKLQYYKNGTTWTDISSTIYNCDTNLSNINVTLPNDWWYSWNWNGTQIQVVRTNDGKVLWTFPQTLNCTAVWASSSSTPSIDEDCNGVWDNSSSYQSSYNYDCSYNSCYTTTL